MQRHILEAALCHETESMQRVALALTKLTQDLKVNTVIAEFLFHKSESRYTFPAAKVQKVSERKAGGWKICLLSLHEMGQDARDVRRIIA